MKNIYFLFFTLCYVMLNGQVITLDSITTFRDNERTKLRDSKKYKYDSNGRTIEEIVYNQNGKIYTKEVITYENDKIKFIDDYTSSDNVTLVRTGSVEKFYDADGNDNLEIHKTLELADSTTYRIEKTYKDNQLKKLISFKLEENGNLNLTNKYEFYYSNGLLDSIDSYIGYDNQLGTWFSILKENYKYNGSGLLIQTIESSYDSLSKEYSKSLKVLNTYDTSNNLITRTFIQFSITGVEEIFFKETNTIDYSLKKESLKIPFQLTDLMVENGFKSTLRERPNDFQVLVTSSLSDYHYNGISKINDIKTLSLNVFPNPTTSEIIIRELNISGDSKIQLISSDGKSFPGKMENNSINVSGLPAGNYVLLVQDKSSIYQGRFVKI